MKWFANNTTNLLQSARDLKEKGDYLQAKDLLAKAYKKRKSRGIILDMLDCCLNLGELDEAEKYFDEYHRVAPNDTTTLYSYRYQLEKKKGRDVSLLITILEELKASDYIEEYAYELAKQYHKAGKTEECMEECKEIILWFGEGAYVERAKALLAYYKGEIGLEEIKTAGERYVAEQMAKQQESASIGEEAGVENETTPEVETDLETDTKIENADSEEFMPQDDPKPVDKSDAKNDSEYSEESIESEEDFLPEIDLSEIDFNVDESQEDSNKVEQKEHEIDSRESYELYEPEIASELEIVKGSKLEKLLLEKDIQIENVCKNFMRIESVRKQIIRSLEMILNERGRLFLVITGERQTGKTTLAYYLIKLLYHMDLVKHDRAAVIDAEKLNEISISDRRDEIEDCNLLIERAGDMKEKTLEELLRVFQGKKNGTCVILEDNSRNINKLLRGKEDLNRRFNNRIHLSKYSTEDLMGFAFDYIAREDYTIDKMAAEVLREKIEGIVRTTVDEKRLVSTLDLVKRVLENSERRNGTAILAMAATGQFKEGNFLVLISEDVEKAEI